MVKTVSISTIINVIFHFPFHLILICFHKLFTHCLQNFALNFTSCKQIINNIYCKIDSLIIFLSPKYFH